MKKLLALLLSLTLVMAFVTGCGKANETSGDKTTDPTTAPTTAPSTDDASTEATAKTGLAVLTSLGKSKASADGADGLAQIDSVVVAVLVGEDGKIVDVDIDASQTKVNFDAEGVITTDKAKVFPTKQELGAEYGMGKVSSIGKEWNDQANALAAYVVGKTVEEVKAIAVTEESVPTEADLTATVTIKIKDYVAAIEKAVATAQDLGAKTTDKLGLSITTNIAKSKDATADAAGVAQAYSTYVATTVNAEGKITSIIIDSSQGNVNFDATGAITSDLTAETKTKQELKEDYGMKKVSAIGKEWYEQANAFATYVTGKTLAEVKGIAMAEGKATDADLLTSVTVTISSLVENIEKAINNANAE